MRSFSCDMCWLLLKMSSENSGFGLKVFILGVVLYLGEGIVEVLKQCALALQEILERRLNSCQGPPRHEPWGRHD